MKTLLRLFFFCVLSAVFGGNASAQEGQTLPQPETDTDSLTLDQRNYRDLREKGINALIGDTTNHREAMRYFVAGLIPARRLPEHDLDSLIDKTLKDWEATLLKVIEEVETTRDSLQITSDSLAALNEELWKLLALNEAYRLALLSENQRTVGRNVGALFLAHRALQIITAPRDTTLRNKTENRIDDRRDIDRIFGNAITPFARRGAARRSNIAELAALSLVDEAGSQVAVNYGGREVVRYRIPDTTELSWRRELLSILDTVDLKGSTPFATAYSPDGRWLLSYGARTAAYRDLQADISRIDTLTTPPVTAAAFFPDRNYRLLLAQDSTARLYNSGRPAWKLAGTPYEAQFSPDGKYLLTRSGNRVVEVWEMGPGPETGKLLNTISHRNYVYSACFSPDGRYVLTAGADSLVRLTVIEGGEEIRLPHEELVVKEARFSPEGDRIFSRTLGSKLFLWDTTGRLLDTLNGHGDRILAARWSPDGEQLLTTAADGTSLLWDREGRIIMQIPLNNLRAPASIFSPDGQWIIAVYGESELRVYPQPAVANRWLAERRNYSEVFSSEQIQEWEQQFDTGKSINNQ